jgi:ribonuclease HII
LSDFGPVSAARIAVETPERARPARCPGPDRAAEREWQALGFRLIAGIDEVGRGPLAGPVVAAAVVLPCRDPAWLGELRDSKELTASERELLAGLIRREALAYGIGAVSAQRIDAIGIAPAAREAMRRALARLAVTPEALLLDAFHLDGVPQPQEAIIRGDSRCSAIAAASIVAKVARDAMMDALDRRFPGYGFARNRGYGTAEHLAALERLGPSPIHRRSFAPLRTWLAGAVSVAR